MPGRRDVRILRPMTMASQLVIRAEDREGISFSRRRNQRRVL